MKVAADACSVAWGGDQHSLSPLRSSSGLLLCGSLESLSSYLLRRPPRGRERDGERESKRERKGGGQDRERERGGESKIKKERR